jgi:hypothetical protein
LFSLYVYSDGLQLEDRGSISTEGKIPPFFTAPRPVMGPTQPFLEQVLESLSPGKKRQRHKADYSPQSSVEVKYNGATPPFPHLSSYGCA